MDKYLLDTHVLLWMTQQPENISIKAKGILESEGILFVSTVSVWEMAIKITAQKLQLEDGLPNFINFSIQKHRLELLPISLQHIYFTQQLALHHRDPFDRLLIAQSFIEDVQVVSADEMFDLYNVNRIWK